MISPDSSLFISSQPFLRPCNSPAALLLKRGVADATVSIPLLSISIVEEAPKSRTPQGSGGARPLGGGNLAGATQTHPLATCRIDSLRLRAQARCHVLQRRPT